MSNEPYKGITPAGCRCGRYITGEEYADDYVMFNSSCAYCHGTGVDPIPKLIDQLARAEELLEAVVDGQGRYSSWEEVVDSIYALLTELREAI